MHLPYNKMNWKFQETRISILLLKWPSFWSQITILSRKCSIIKSTKSLSTDKNGNGALRPDLHRKCPKEDTNNSCELVAKSKFPATGIICLSNASKLYSEELCWLLMKMLSMMFKSIQSSLITIRICCKNDSFV